MTTPTEPLTAREREELRYLLGRIDLGYLLVTDSKGPTVAQATLRLLADHDRIAAEVADLQERLDSDADLNSARTLLDRRIDERDALAAEVERLRHIVPAVLEDDRDRAIERAQLAEAALAKDAQPHVLYHKALGLMRDREAALKEVAALTAASKSLHESWARENDRANAAARELAAEVERLLRLTTNLLRAAEVAADNALAFKADRDAAALDDDKETT